MDLPKVFVLELTKRYNNRCLYCYTVWGADSLGYDNGSNEEMSLDQIKQVVLKPMSQTDLEGIRISGGEPFLRSDLPDILSFLNDQGITPMVVTNGTLLTKMNVGATMTTGHYEVTLLSYDHKVHDHLVGRKGAWRSVVRGMTNIRLAGGDLTMSFVATRLNSRQLEDTVKLGVALGATGIMYNRMNLSAHNFPMADTLLPTKQMIIENLDTLERFGKEYGIPIMVSVVIEPCVIDLGRYEHIHFGWCPLGGEGSYYTIDPRGNVRICNHSPVILGNILEQDLVDIVRDLMVSHFRETWPDECMDCDPKRKDICRGGCKAASEQCYGTVSRVDPFVTFSQKAP